MFKYLVENCFDLSNLTSSKYMLSFQRKRFLIELKPRNLPIMFKKPLSLTVIVCFFLTSLGPLPKAHADTVLGLPAPGTMVNLSTAYQPVIIRGLTIHKDNPFLFDFIVDEGQDRISGEPLKQEGEKLIKYFWFFSWFFNWIFL